MLSTSSLRLNIGSLLLGLIVCALMVCSSAVAAERSPLERLSSLLEAEKLRADHILLVDLSGSTAWRAERGAKQKASPGKSRLDTLLRALPALLEAIPRGDYVVVLGFHGDLVEDPSLLVSDISPDGRWHVVIRDGRLEVVSVENEAKS